MPGSQSYRQSLVDGLQGITRSYSGRNLYAKENYGFASFRNDSAVKLRADLAFFNSPIPSIDSAVLGVFSQNNAISDPETIIDYSYLGAPFILIDNSETVQLYKFEGVSDFHIVEELPSKDFRSEWKRLNLEQYIAANRASLQFGRSKSLMIQAAKSSLLDRMNALLQLIIEDGKFEAESAFEIAMLAIRKLSLGDHSNAFTRSSRNKVEYAENIAASIESVTSFDNIPPESLAEIYEAFAVTKEIRKRNGVVYTPAWLTKYLVSRIPKEAFHESLLATDPACGSGTFLIAYLERYLSERGTLQNCDLLDISGIVKGFDIDPVAVELTKLALDFLAKAVDAPAQTWDVTCADSTAIELNSDWFIGNLPFGYRSHQGKDDISNKIIDRIFTGESPRGICLIFPESLAYNTHARSSRESIREHIVLEEVIKFPENTFDTAAARTIALIGRSGRSDPEILVRDVTDNDIFKFRMGLYSSKNFVSRLPEQIDEEWVFSPFNNSIAKAEGHSKRLDHYGNIMVGMQIYGYEEAAKGRGDKSRAFLEDPKKFIEWSPRSYTSIPRIIPNRENFRRTGPWDKCDEPKIIIRSTTYPENDGRLSAIVDNQGIWFSDKFTGIWLKTLAEDEGLTLDALATYLQSRFARVWFGVNNPSRKLRISTLKKLPIPKLPKSTWERAAKLSKANSVTRPRKNGSGSLFSDSNYSNAMEWERFNSAVEAAFNIDAGESIEMSRWLEKLK